MELMISDSVVLTAGSRLQFPCSRSEYGRSRSCAPAGASASFRTPPSGRRFHRAEQDFHRSPAERQLVGAFSDHRRFLLAFYLCRRPEGRIPKGRRHRDPDATEVGGTD